MRPARGLARPRALERWLVAIGGGCWLAANGCAAAAPAQAPAARAPRVAQLPAEVHPLGPCVPVGYEVCSNGLDDNCNGVLEEGCGVLGGVVQFVASWHELRADVDLEVTDPEGHLVEVGRPAPSGLKKARDCPGVNDDCDGRNLEDVYLDGASPPPLGTYGVRLRLEALGGESLPIWVTLSARLGNTVVAYEVELSREDQEVGFELSM